MKSIEKELSVRVKADRRPKWLRHLCTVHHHRALVRKYCFKLGLYRQGLMHDLSKYSPTEFFVGAKYYQGYRSPNTAERLDRGYSSAWLHHKGRNKHHLEYWIDYSLQKDGYPLTGMEMPVKYVAEMLCDRIAACRVYQGEAYTDASAWQYYENGLRVNTMIMHPKTGELLETMLHMLAEKGEEETFAYIRREVLGKKA
mgnify:FL=1